MMPRPLTFGILHTSIATATSLTCWLWRGRAGSRAANTDDETNFKDCGLRVMHCSQCQHRRGERKRRYSGRAVMADGSEVVIYETGLEHRFRLKALP